ncbi:MAG: Membrane protein insertase YidC, partial [Francisellaceae bacterium]|nr:Membrane protein insertase YidC [Francisellaceae bacterium]
MDFQRIRFFLLIGLALVGSYLFNVWQQEQSLKKASMLPRATHLSEKNHGETPLDVLDIPDLKEGNDSNNLETLQKSSLPIFSSKDLIDVKTKVMHLKINKNGGDIVYLSLPQFKDDKNLSP